MRKLFIAWCLLFLAVRLSASTAYNGCPDFSNLYGDYVEAFTKKYSYWSREEAGDSIVPGRHTLITEAGTDIITDNSLNVLPEGETWSVKLGNEQVGAEGEGITYQFIPDEENPILLVRYAIVLEDPGHKTEAQPYFSVSITDADGVPLTKNASYEVYAQPGLEGFNETSYHWSSVLWRDWTSILLDLRQYVGKVIKVRFETRDCLQSGHFGYAYFNAKCTAYNTGIQNCSGKGDVSLSLPEGYASYKWSDGSNLHTYTGEMSSQGLWCDLTSVMGDVERVYFVLADKQNPIADEEYGTICEGQDFNWHGKVFKGEKPGTSNYHCYEVDLQECTTSKKDLVLKTVASITRIDTTICEGTSFVDYGFNIVNPPLGHLTDTLVVDTLDGCVVMKILNLTVANSTDPVIEGDSLLCIGNKSTYYVEGNWLCQWDIPESVNLVNIASDSKSIALVTNNDDDITLNVTYSNGCKSGTVGKLIKPVSAIHIVLYDTVCQNSVYNKNGFDLGVQEKTGPFIHIKQFDDTCNSYSVLHLYVAGVQNDLKIEGDSVICKGQSVTLTTGANTIAAGDILCTDGSILRFSDYLTSGKVAKGIVIEVAIDGQHGYAIALEDLKGSILGKYTYSEEKRVEYGIAPYEVMLSAAIQAYYLNEELEQIPGAEKLTGTYWTSTPNGTNKGYLMDFDNSPMFNDPTSSSYSIATKVRTVYSF